MIISASRRTDIPAFHFEWFLRRLEAGEVLVRNPFNHYQVSRIDLSPNIVDCIVFWTKNPAPMLNKLDRLKDYNYYIQFTINPYGEDLEKNLPSKQSLFDTFKALSDIVGPDRVIWRYSPVILNNFYNREYHYDAFGRMAEILTGYTSQCNLSFIEMYKKITRKMIAKGVSEIPEESKNNMAIQFQRIAKENGIKLKACGNLDLNTTGIEPAKCIDDEIISKITGLKFNLKKDKGQDAQCHCVTSIDIGTYNTCLNGCEYCYANAGSGMDKKVAAHDLDSPFLCSSPTERDKITDRKVKKEGRKE